MNPWLYLAVVVFSSAVIVLVVLGAAFRPHIVALVSERDYWRARAIAAEDQAAGASYEGVKLIDPKDPDLDVWTRGLGPTMEVPGASDQ